MCLFLDFDHENGVPVPGTKDDSAVDYELFTTPATEVKRITRSHSTASVGTPNSGTDSNSIHIYSWVIFLHAFLSSAFFQNKLFEKVLSGIPSVSNSLIQIRPDILLDLVWVQTVCKVYQQTTLRGRVNTYICIALTHFWVTS